MVGSESAGRSTAKLHYAWFVMVAYGLMMCGTIGSFSVISAQWFYPVSADIGCELSTLTLYTTIEMACMGLAMPLVGSLLTRVKLPVLLTGAVLMEVLATAAMAFYSEPWMWYASSVFIGLGLAATSTVTVTPTMGNWFAKKTGFAIGVVWAIQAMFCAVASPLFAAIIMVIGWRAAYLVLAAASACLALPAVIFVIRYRPEDVGLLPYGYEETSVRQSRGAAPGVSARTAFRSAPFFLCAGIVTLCQGTACMNAIFPTYAEVVGLGAVVGGLMVSAASLCDIAFNPIAGATSDRFGPTRSMVLWTGITMVSLVVLYFSGSSPAGSCVGAGLNDAMYAITGVGYSTFALSIFGLRDFEKIFSRITCCGYLAASLGIPLMMGIYEATGVFQNVFVFCFVIDIVIIALVLAARKLGKALRWSS
ncbi:MFS transporter [Enterorhabdus sp. NM05_H27]|nr:MFS transporter [Enterorhabdus sp. NM05_H27]